MPYIKRDMEEKILSLSQEYPCLLVTGPRQVGKTTVLRQLMTPDRNYVTLDDLAERRLAKEDPALFLQLHDLPAYAAPTVQPDRRRWCIVTAGMVHGDRRCGAPGRHAENYSGMPLRLRMDSPSIWMV